MFLEAQSPQGNLWVPGEPQKLGSEKVGPRILFHSAASLAWGPRSSLRLPFLQKQKAVPCQGSPTCGVGEAGLAPKTGAHGRRAGTAREPPNCPHVVPRRRQQMVDGSPASLFRPRLSQPSFQPSHVKVLTGSLHLLATPLSLGPSQGVYKQRSSCPEVPEFTSCGVWAAGRACLALPWVSDPLIVPSSIKCCSCPRLAPAGLVMGNPLQYKKEFPLLSPSYLSSSVS